MLAEVSAGSSARESARPLDTGSAAARARSKEVSTGHSTASELAMTTVPVLEPERAETLGPRRAQDSAEEWAHDLVPPRVTKTACPSAAMSENALVQGSAHSLAQA